MFKYLKRVFTLPFHQRFKQQVLQFQFFLFRVGNLVVQQYRQQYPVQFIKIITELLLIYEARRTLYQRRQKLVPLVTVVVTWWLVQFEQCVIILPNC